MYHHHHRKDESACSNSAWTDVWFVRQACLFEPVTWFRWNELANKVQAVRPNRGRPSSHPLILSSALTVSTTHAACWQEGTEPSDALVYMFSATVKCTHFPALQTHLLVCFFKLNFYIKQCVGDIHTFYVIIQKKGVHLEVETLLI